MTCHSTTVVAAVAAAIVAVAVVATTTTTKAAVAAAINPHRATTPPLVEPTYHGGSLLRNTAIIKPLFTFAVTSRHDMSALQQRGDAFPEMPPAQRCFRACAAATAYKAAVSVRKRLLPNVTGTNPFSMAIFTSSGLKSPSGPISTTTSSDGR